MQIIVVVDTTHTIYNFQDGNFPNQKPRTFELWTEMLSVTFETENYNPKKKVTGGALNGARSNADFTATNTK